MARGVYDPMLHSLLVLKSLDLCSTFRGLGSRKSALRLELLSQVRRYPGGALISLRIKTRIEIDLVQPSTFPFVPDMPSVLPELFYSAQNTCQTTSVVLEVVPHPSSCPYRRTSGAMFPQPR